jgi:SWI/SNF-related matrix-associated actin-dependent regulator of chromatin subfamily A member 5
MKSVDQHMLQAEASKAPTDMKKLMSLMAQLRKASNHPYLFPNVEIPNIDGTPTEEIVTASGKMIVLDRLLPKLLAKGHRVVLFSQFTRTLDIISDYLHMRGHRHNRLDGSTNRVMREVYINMFNRPKSPIPIFLLSTRAGGEGVNLFTADTVILFDSDWNPQVDIQAMARVHRIGQTKVVHVYRLVTAGSVEGKHAYMPGELLGAKCQCFFCFYASFA